MKVVTPNESVVISCVGFRTLPNLKTSPSTLESAGIGESRALAKMMESLNASYSHSMSVTLATSNRIEQLIALEF